MARIIRKHALFLLILAVLTVARCFLLTQGSFSLPGERRYVSTLKILPALTELNFQKFFGRVLETTHGRPGAALIWLVPGAVQYWSANRSGLELFHPTPVIAAVSFNLVVLTAILIFFYLITLKVFPNQPLLSAACTLVYGLLTNSNIYLPHFMPYSTALLFFLIALNYAIKYTIQGIGLHRFHFMLLGLLCLFAFSIYPGFYFFPLIISCLLFLRPGGLFSRKALPNMCNFAAGALVVIICLESLTFSGKHAYTASLHGLAHTVDQGSHSEGFSYLFKYLAEVEGPLGYAVIVLSLLYLALSLKRIVINRSFDKLFSSPQYPFLLAAAGLIIHGILTYCFEFMVFYGRLLHMYFPFLILGSFAFLAEIKAAKLKNSLWILAVVLAFWSASSNIRSYRALDFPRDTFISLGINPASLETISESDTCDYQTIAPYPAAKFLIQEAPDATYTAVNFCYFFPVEEPLTNYHPPEDSTLLFQGTHFQSFPAYYYEGFPIKDRQRLAERKYQLRLYRRFKKTGK